MFEYGCSLFLWKTMGYHHNEDIKKSNFECQKAQLYKSSLWWYWRSVFYFAVTWRADGRCGKNFPMKGSPSKCNPDGLKPCCSNHGWCGYGKEFCNCRGCHDYSKRARARENWRHKNGPLEAQMVHWRLQWSIGHSNGTLEAQIHWRLDGSIGGSNGPLEANVFG